MKNDSNDYVSTVSNHSTKPRSRQVNSRFMSPSPSSNSTGPPEPGSSCLSPVSRKPGSRRGQHSGTLADQIGNDRLRDREDKLDGKNQKPTKTTSITSTTSSVFSPLRKLRSCREFNIFENNNISKENDRPVIGRSTRFSFPGKSSSSSLSSRRNLDCSTNSVDSELGYASLNSLPRTRSSRKSGREVSSKYIATSARSGTSDLDFSNPLSMDDSRIKKTSSLTGYLSSKSQWSLSPGRSSSPSMSMDRKEKPLSFSSLRPPHKSVEKILNIGFDLFRTKKSATSSSSMGFTNSEAIHKLRLLHNQFIQWRFANARAHAVNHNISLHAENNLIYALDGLTKLQHSVLQKKIQLEREKLEMKLNFVLHSQMKLLETWGIMERQHLAAITSMKECLYTVVCKVPLLEGAKVDIQLASIAQRHASDITSSIKLVLSSFSPSADKTAELLSELAKVVAQEKLLLEEFNDLFRSICVLELKERSLKCSLIQLK
ncbi:QWRF motif-containing protein 3-like [Gastrolobium bilobum]|uniref:QWRF motif-containing protein 3-like n=1 Tax=Gastrolobium bilobum TaxID=150636 RepID=UPI002AB2532A|nr:QWRF motif-containing protein 3-like [Gastrolobium bilobum]